MATSNLNFDKDVVPHVRRYAKVAFSHDKDRPEKTADSISEAWRWTQVAGPQATAKGIAWYAVHRVKAGRHFTQSERSITGPSYRKQVKAKQRNDVDVAELESIGDDPAKLAAMRIDFPVWFNDELRQRKREICAAMLMGYSTQEIAEQFGVSWSAISQTRRWLVENWLAFTA